MLSVYVPHGPCLDRIQVEPGTEVPPNAIWFDLTSPTQSEDKLVESHVGISVPTREEMQEIEVTSRLYVENGARYMTATLMCQSDTETPKTTPVTFIIAGHRLITVRYDEPRPFMIVGHKLARTCPSGATGEIVMMELLDAVIDRSADILERISSEIDQVSHEIFEPEGTATDHTRGYNEIMKSIGRKGDLTSKVRESLVSIGRLLLYLANEADNMKWAKDMRAQLKGMQRDVQSLSDHATYVSQQDHLPARCAAWFRQHRAEQHHQVVLGRRRDADAADAGRLDLRHELQEYSGARFSVRLSDGAYIDAAIGSLAVFLLQVEEMVLRRRAFEAARADPDGLAPRTRVSRPADAACAFGAAP